jgi:hypothetical protein
VIRVPAAVQEDWSVLSTETPSLRRFNPGMAADLPDPVRRWLAHSVDAGTPLWESVEIMMEGEIRLRGAWWPFVARQVLAPSRGFIWAARARMRGVWISGYDRFSAGTGQMSWRLLGLLPVMSAEGEDVTRSALGRLVGEGVILPTAFRGARWRLGRTDDVARMSRTVDGGTEEAELTIGGDGRLNGVLMSRWGDPDGTGFARYPFGVHIEQERDFGGVRMPCVFRAGWWTGTAREEEGEFFHATLTSAVFR